MKFARTETNTAPLFLTCADDDDDDDDDDDEIKFVFRWYIQYLYAVVHGVLLLRLAVPDLGVGISFPMEHRFNCDG